MTRTTLFTSSAKMIDRSLQQPYILENLSELLQHDVIFVSDAYTMPDLLAVGIRSHNISSANNITENTRFVIGSNDDFNQLCKIKRNVYKVGFNSIDKYAVWQKSNIGANMNILRQIALSERLFDIFQPTYTDLPVTIVYADHGMGKTTFLRQIQSKILNKNNIFSLYLTDIDFYRYFNCTTDRNAETFSKFINIVKIKTNIHLLVDNFETMPEVDDVINIMQQFHLRHRNVKLWITCSKVVTRTKLETKLGAFACHLAPLELVSQLETMKNIWKLREGNILYVIKNYLDICSRDYWGPSSKEETKQICVENKLVFTSYPLHLEMIAAKFVIQRSGPPPEIRILDIFEHYVNKHYFHKHVEELAVIEFCKNMNYKISFDYMPQTFDFKFSSIVNFLAAKWFSKNLKGNEEIIRLIMASETSSWQFEYFFDRYLCRDSLLHIAVLNRDLQAVKFLSEFSDVNALDEAGRTALQLCHDYSFAIVIKQNGGKLSEQM